MAVSLADVQPLLDQFQGAGLMVSCYADLSVERGFQSRWSGPFKAKADAIKKDLAGDQRVWQACAQDLEIIQRALDGPEARHARGMAVFSAKQRGFFRAVPLVVPVENDLVIHQAPYLVPLLEALHRQRDYLVVHSDTHRGRLYAANVGGTRLLQEIDEAVPKKQHSAGQLWGTQQATVARHRQDHILHYQKELLGIVEAVWTKHSYQGLVLRVRLPARLADQVILEAPLAAGPRQVVDAVQNGQVGARGYGYVVLGPDPREAVARCTACRFLSVEMPKICPLCQSPCVEANLWEELLLLAL